jgi:hypothetical protein
MIYVPSFIKIGSGVQKLIGRDSQTHTQTAMLSHKHKQKLNSVALVHERNIPVERPPLVGEVSANFCG